MVFKDKLAEYFELLDCSAKDLAESSGLSAATISRYRAGERVPEVNSKNFLCLVEGIVRISKDKGISDITVQSVSDAFVPFVKSSAINTENLRVNLNILLNALNVSIAELSRFLNYDASYISRIKNGKRQPSDPQKFALGVADFIVRRYQTNSQKAIIADLINCKPEELANDTSYQSLLIKWLSNKSDEISYSKDSLISFLEKLDMFNLNEYIRSIHFDEIKVPSAPFHFPTSKSYFGLNEMMESELDFLKSTVLSNSDEPVIMYSDMPMDEMAKDPDFPKKWMFGMAMLLKKGLHLNQIHNIDRSFTDMMLGLESWIPMYMTGQISPYYLKDTQNNIFSHFLKVSGSVALTGEAISGYHNEGRYYLTNKKNEVTYYKRRAERLLSIASPLMKIYRKEHLQSYNSFMQDDAEIEGNRYFILSALSLHTTTDDLISHILSHNEISEAEQLQIRQYVASQREMTNKILQHSHITEEIPILSKEEFEQFPMVLSLSGMFYEKDILYTWDDYQEHLHLVQEYQKQHSNYSIVENQSSAFRNIQIYIHKGKWVIVSKNKTPAIHFLIRHPKMRNAFENIVIPIIED